jgi:hypothetical protein
MEKYLRVIELCNKYGCKFEYTLGTDCKIISKCGHVTIVQPNQFIKHKLGVYCQDCLDNIFDQQSSVCFNCNVSFSPTKTRFLFCTPRCSVLINMSEDRREKHKQVGLKNVKDYLNEDGTLKSSEKIEEIKNSKKRKLLTQTCEFVDTNGEQQKISKKSNFVEYTNIKNAYESKGCKLLTTEEEYLTLRQKLPLKNLLFDMISICGHTEKSLYYSFIGSNTCLYCKRCTIVRAREISILQAKNDDGYGASLVTQKLAIDIVKKTCENYFDVVKTNDGCDSDIIIRPKNTHDDLWLKIKIKSTIYSEGSIQFRINKIHNSIYIMVSITTQEMWLFDPDKILIKTYYMGNKRAQYDDNFIKSQDNLQLRLNTKYNDKLYTDTFVQVNRPIGKTMQLEYEYVLKRESTIDFLEFKRNEITGSVYNFKVGDLKFQETVFSIMVNKTSLTAYIGKNSGRKTRKPYERGDNDFYWLNPNDTNNNFYVVPESALISNGYISDAEKIGKTYLSINMNSWLKNYKFNYNTIKTNSESGRLRELLGILD